MIDVHFHKPVRDIPTLFYLNEHFILWALIRNGLQYIL